MNFVSRPVDPNEWTHLKEYSSENETVSIAIWQYLEGQLRIIVSVRMSPKDKFGDILLQA